MPNEAQARAPQDAQGSQGGSEEHTDDRKAQEADKGSLRHVAKKDWFSGSLRVDAKALQNSRLFKRTVRRVAKRQKDLQERRERRAAAYLKRVTTSTETKNPVE